MEPESTNTTSYYVTIVGGQALSWPTEYSIRWVLSHPNGPFGRHGEGMEGYCRNGGGGERSLLRLGRYERGVSDILYVTGGEVDKRSCWDI